MSYYFSRLYEKYQLPVYPVVLFSYNAPQRPEPDIHQVAFPNCVVLEFNYRVIQLNQLHWRDFVRQSNPVASALFMSVADRMAKMKMATEERPRVKQESVMQIVTSWMEQGMPPGFASGMSLSRRSHWSWVKLLGYHRLMALKSCQLIGY